MNPVVDNQKTEPRACIEQIESIHQRYRALASQCSDEDIPHLAAQRLGLILWRQGLLQQYLQQLPAWPTNERLNYLLKIGVYPPEGLRAGIADSLEPMQFAQFMARQGVRTQGTSGTDPLAGPARVLPVQANSRSRWPFSRWCDDPQFSEYLFENNKVLYRGIEFMPGDVLLTNTNRDGNGIYIINGIPAGHFPHSGFYALLSHQGRQIPCVMETYEFGVRAVPLNTFLHPRFSSYVEVHRHRDISAEHDAAINACARFLMENTKGYNFDTEDPNRDYVSCTTIGQFMFQDAGLKPITRRSRSDPEIAKNLAKVGYNSERMLYPIDYARDPIMRCVGWVDNHHGNRLLARWFVERELSRQLATRDLDTGAVPLHSKLNRWAIRQVRAQTMLAKPLEAITGFDQYSLPKGPDALLAIITVLEKALGKKIGALDAYLRKRDQRTPMSPSEIFELLHDRDLITIARQLMRFPWLRDRA